jgi:biotin carboxyl carrier protein
MSASTYEITTGGVTRLVQIEAAGEGIGGQGWRYRISIDGGPVVLVEAQRPEQGLLSLLIDGRSLDVGVLPTEEGFECDVLGIPHEVGVVDPQRRPLRHAGSDGAAVIKAQMPGRIVRRLVEEGAVVGKGDPLLVVEAMKMENEIKAPRPGRVLRFAVAVGDLVEARALLVELGDL